MKSHNLRLQGGQHLPNVSHDIQAQRDYLDQMKRREFDFSLVAAVAFVRGMRDLGYKHTGTAFDELIDNAVQANARNVHVVFDFDGKPSRRPSRIAIIDDGHGMEPDMIRAAVIWGGTHRENNRKGFGRYGYGLPSAAVSQCKRYTVFSKVEGGEFHGVTIDLDDIEAGAYDVDGRIIVPKPQQADLPAWLNKAVKTNFGSAGLEHGTIVVFDNLDRLSPGWRWSATLKANLIEHLGLVYRKYLHLTEIHVDGCSVEAIDPLFISPDMKYFQEDNDRAIKLPGLVSSVEISDTGIYGSIAIRYAYFPVTFQRINKRSEHGRRNNRFRIMKSHQGIVLCRNGRQIGVVTKSPWFSFGNYDHNWGVEIDFTATLDEEFGVTTIKQGGILSDEMWNALERLGLRNAIRSMRRRVREELAQVCDQYCDRPIPSSKVASEQAMEEAQKFKTVKPAGDPVEREERSQAALHKEAEQKSQATGRPVVEVKAELVAELQGHPYKVMKESMYGAPFFRVEQVGGQKRLYVNTANRFYQDFYAHPDMTPRLRAALETTLLVMGECELDADSDRRLFYETERAEWSKMLNVAIAKLVAPSLTLPTA